MLNEAVAMLLSFELTLAAPHVPCVTVNVLVVLGYVIVPLLVLIYPLQSALFTVNAYVALALL